jgi:hypothetical protein
VQGAVAKSTHAGIPWLRFIRQRLGARVHFWPFDGWDIPDSRFELRASKKAIRHTDAMWSEICPQRIDTKRSLYSTFGKNM